MTQVHPQNAVANCQFNVSQESHEDSTAAIRIWDDSAVFGGMKQDHPKNVMIECQNNVNQENQQETTPTRRIQNNSEAVFRRSTQTHQQNMLIECQYDGNSETQEGTNTHTEIKDRKMETSLINTLQDSREKNIKMMVHTKIKNNKLCPCIVKNKYAVLVTFIGFILTITVPFLIWNDMMDKNFYKFDKYWGYSKYMTFYVPIFIFGLRCVTHGSLTVLKSKIATSRWKYLINATCDILYSIVTCITMFSFGFSYITGGHIFGFSLAFIFLVRGLLAAICLMLGNITAKKYMLYLVKNYNYRFKLKTEGTIHNFILEEDSQPKPINTYKKKRKIKLSRINKLLLITLIILSITSLVGQLIRNFFGGFPEEENLGKGDYGIHFELLIKFGATKQCIFLVLALLMLIYTSIFFLLLQRISSFNLQLIFLCGFLIIFSVECAIKSLLFMDSQENLLQTVAIYLTYIPFPLIITVLLALTPNIVASLSSVKEPNVDEDEEQRDKKDHKKSSTILIICLLILVVCVFTIGNLVQSNKKGIKYLQEMKINSPDYPRVTATKSWKIRIWTISYVNSQYFLTCSLLSAFLYCMTRINYNKLEGANTLLMRSFWKFLLGLLLLISSVWAGISIAYLEDEIGSKYSIACYFNYAFVIIGFLSGFFLVLISVKAIFGLLFYILKAILNPLTIIILLLSEIDKDYIIQNLEEIIVDVNHEDPKEDRC